MIQERSDGAMSAVSNFVATWQSELLWGLGLTGGAALVFWLIKKTAPQPTEDGEMPFLDHLEELRWRVLWSGAAVVVGAVIGYYLVSRFDFVTILKQPIEAHLDGGRLVFTRPTDAFVIRIKLAVLTGFVLAFPVVLNQVWAFLAPALHEHEKKHIGPAAIAGTGLFIVGAWMAFLWILPAALNIMLSDVFVGEGLEPLITAGDYFSFATTLIMAFGFVFELPLVMVMLSIMGLVNPEFFAKHRQYAVLVGAIISAFVTPPDAFTMVMMMAPILILYEVGIAVGRLVWKQKHPNTIGPN